MAGWFLLNGQPSNLAALPKEWFQAFGVVAILPDSLLAFLFKTQVLLIMKWAAVSLSVILVLGLGPYRPLAITFCILYFILVSLGVGFGGFVGHARKALMFCTWVLAMFPAADALAVGRRPQSARDPAEYRAPLVYMTAVFTICYAFLGLRRLVHGGMEIFTGDAIAIELAMKSLMPSRFGYEYGTLALTSPTFALLMKAGFFGITVAELLAPICLFSKPFRYLWAAIMVPFHISTLFTMNIFFANNMVLILLLMTPLGSVFNHGNWGYRLLHRFRQDPEAGCARS